MDPTRTLSNSIERLEGRIAPAFAAVIELSTLAGDDGFKINGEATNNRAGYSVSDAGDVNGDGFDDILIGAYSANSNGSYSGSSYVVFGKATILPLASISRLLMASFQ